MKLTYKRYLYILAIILVIVVLISLFIYVVKPQVIIPPIYSTQAPNTMGVISSGTVSTSAGSTRSPSISQTQDNIPTTPFYMSNPEIMAEIEEQNVKGDINISSPSYLTSPPITVRNIPEEEVVDNDAVVGAMAGAAVGAAAGYAAGSRATAGVRRTVGPYPATSRAVQSNLPTIVNPSLTVRPRGPRRNMAQSSTMQPRQIRTPSGPIPTLAQRGNAKFERKAFKTMRP